MNTLSDRGPANYEPRDRICLKGMRFHTRVGVLPHEAHVPQPLELDLVVWLSLQEVGESDSPKGIVDYRDLYDRVASTVGNSHHKLLEALCEQISSAVLDIDGVRRVEVAARKPHAPIDGPLDYVEVVVIRDKSSS